MIAELAGFLAEAAFWFLRAIPGMLLDSRKSTGLIDGQGIKTPYYYALQILCKLGGELLFQEDGIVVTKETVR